MKSRAQAAAAVAILALAAFTPALWNASVEFDDPAYITRNGVVQGGLSLRGVWWAFHTFDTGNWHPLTWLSHMLDWQLFGGHLWGHHLVGILLHAGVAALVFWLFDESTGSRGRSLLAAALFAVHPLRVESVAWLSERKDVLCAVFFLAACLAHVRRVRSGGTGTWVSVFAVLALMAKPMAVSLPVVLLILDFWPLERKEGLRRLLVEKAPVIALAALGCAITMFAQKYVGAMSTMTLSARLRLVPLNVVDYLRLTVWPVGLLPLYLLPRSMPAAWKLIAAAVAVAGITALAAAMARRRPALAFGWSWFLVTLLPVVGIVHVGMQSVADRYTYLPHVGLFGAVAFLLPEPAPRWRAPVVGAFAALLAVLAAMTFAQTRRWKDSHTLFTYTLSLSPGNPVAATEIAAEQLEKNNLPEAERVLQETLQVAPGYARAIANLSSVRVRQGHLQEALELISRAQRIKPMDFEVGIQYAKLLHVNGKDAEALAEFERIYALEPTFPGLLLPMGVQLSEMGHTAEAVPLLQAAVAEDPADAHGHAALGVALGRMGQYPQAIAELEKALRIRPDYRIAQEMLRRAREDAARRP